MTTERLNWPRLVGEAVIIVASVYLAILLEGRSDDRARIDEAHTALENLRSELIQDQVDLEEVAGVQAAHTVRYARLISWLDTPDLLPRDSFAVDLAEVLYDNRTIFPRASSWNTMVASGQLPFLQSSELVAQLADLYENLNSRVNHNGASYDEGLEDLARNSLPRFWDSIDRQLLVTDLESVRVFRGQLDYLLGWNRFYMELISAWGGELTEVIEDVDNHLTDYGRGA